eukprot:7177203-Pyramimonas_sp.AAC.1
MWCPEVSSSVPSYGVPLSETDSEIDSETDNEIERCPAVSRGVPEIENEIDKCPVVSRGTAGTFGGAPYGATKR